MSNQDKIKEFRNVHLGSCDMTIFGERVSSKEPKFDKNAHTFDTVAPIQ